MKLIINTDGGARGNPGPAACGFVASFAKATEGQGFGSFEATATTPAVINREKCGKYLGVTTNNQAEYAAVIVALKWAKGNLGNRGDGGNQGKIEEIVIKSDSLLLVSQLSGKWKIKDRDLQKLVMEVKLLERDINAKIRYMHVPRELNREADFEVNRILDLESLT